MRRTASLPETSSLARALCADLEPAPCIAFTGSGGKTTCSEEMAWAAAAAGLRVVLTTTTRIRVPARSVEAHDLAGVDAALQAACDRVPPEPLFLGRAAVDGKKLTGPSLDLLDEIRRSGHADLLVLEADGARGGSIKAYRDQEPVLSSQVDRVCVVLGVDAVGADFSSPLVHRAEKLWPLLGLGPDARLGLEDVVRAVVSQPAYLAHGMRLVTLLLNKVDDPAAREQALRLLAAFEPHLADTSVGRVLLRGEAAQGGLEEVWRFRPRRIAALVLAAGASRRFGSLKQVAPWDGVPMVRRALDTVREAGPDEVVLVVGTRSDEVARAAAAKEESRVPTRVVVNPSPELGLSSSIQAGLAAVADACDGVLVCMGDQPLLRPDTVRRVLERARQGDRGIVLPTCRGRRGHPVFFARRWFPSLRRLRGDVGGAAVLQDASHDRTELAVDDPGVFFDVDTPADAHAREGRGER